MGGGTMHINETSRTVGAITQHVSVWERLKGMEYINQFPRCTYYTGSRTATQAMLGGILMS